MEGSGPFVYPTGVFTLTRYMGWFDVRLFRQLQRSQVVNKINYQCSHILMITINEDQNNVFANLAVLIYLFLTNSQPFRNWRSVVLA